MTDQDTWTMREAMDQYGGGFVEAFAECLARADRNNFGRLLNAFPELVEQYGPGSKFFDAIRATEES